MQQALQKMVGEDWRLEFILPGTPIPDQPEESTRSATSTISAAEVQAAQEDNTPVSTLSTPKMK